MTYKLKTTTDENGVISLDGAPTSTSGFDRVIDGLTLPLKALSDSDTYVNEKTAAQIQVATGVVAFFAGELVGHKRSADGSTPFIPAI